MKKINVLGLIVSIVLVITSCGPRLYYSPKAKMAALQHKVIAVLPPEVSIMNKKNLSEDVLEEMKKQRSYEFQNEMYSWLLTWQGKGKIKQEIQDVALTNSKLKSVENIKNLTPKEICDILGVDGYIRGSITLANTMSEGASIALTAIFLGLYPTKDVQVSFSLNDCEDGKLLWSYKHKWVGYIYSSFSNMVEKPIKKASKKIPYNEKSRQ